MDKDRNLKELKIKIGDCMKAALLRAKPHSATNGRSEIMTVDLVTQKLEKYVTERNSRG